MTEGILNVTDENFEEEVLKNDLPVLVDFWAVWCAPCKMFAPVFEKLQQEYSNKFIFVKVNVDENQMVTNQYKITAIPTTLFLKNGKVMNKIVGATNYKKMKQVLESLN